MKSSMTSIRVIYVHRGREKVDFKSREVNCLKECALALSIKVIGSYFYTSIYNKRDDFGFPIVYLPWLIGDVPRLPSYNADISQLVRFARCCTCVFDIHSKNIQITFKLLTQGYRYNKLRKNIWKVLQLIL